MPMSVPESSKIHVFPCRTDNIGVLLHDCATGATAAIDAPEENAVLAALEATGWQLTDILVTHKHSDHIAGIPGLKQRFPSARVMAPAGEADVIPLVDETVKDGDTVSVGNLRGQVMATPGHTLGHVVYWFPEEKALFAGDTLFSLGCGRILEGTPEAMWQAISRLAALPDDTRLYCGHEYTLSNARFALTVEPDNTALQAMAKQAEATRAAGNLTIPSLLGDEKAANPFMRAGEATVAKAMHLAGKPPAEVFAAVRTAKDNA